MKSQKEIHTKIAEIIAKYAGVSEGMGQVNTESIHIQMKEDMTPITQGKYPIPIQFKKAVKQKIEYWWRDRFHLASVKGGSTTWL